MADMNKSEQNELKAHYDAAKKRLLLLDYDGTLAPIVEQPEDAAPSREILNILKKLTDDTRNTITIISGRPHEILEQWIGQLPLEFVAEHSVMRRDRNGKWQMMVAPDETQIAAAAALLKSLLTEHPGTMLEEKRVGIALHYRHAPTLDDTKIQQWIMKNRPEFERYNLAEIQGKKVVELLPRGVDKGTAAHHWLDAAHWDFVLAAGDDTTDEAMFRALGPKDHSVHIGNNSQTAAVYTLPDQSDFTVLLERLV